MSRRSDRLRRVTRAERTGMAPFKAGAIALTIALAITYLGFTKDIPFIGGGFELKAAVQSANSIRLNSPVRIAGVNVGKVTAVKHDHGIATITMSIDDRGLPIHSDATLKIRPRIFLEGNFFVDLQPGSPSAPVMDAGDTIPVTRTAYPVQLDQILTSLQADSRADLQSLLHEYATALTHVPTPAEDVGADPAIRGETAAKSLNDALATGPDALRGAALVQGGLLGIGDHDVSTLVAGLGRITASLSSRERELQDLLVNLDATMGALASQQSNLRASVRLLAPTVENAGRTLATLNAALPSTSAFARDILPGVKELPATIAAAFPWIDAAMPLLGPDELQGVARQLRPATKDLATLIDESTRLLPQLDLFDRCIKDVVLPTGDVKLDDGPLSTGKENYKEFWYTMAGLAGESENFDGNGSYVRFAVGGGTQTLATGASSLSGDTLFGNATSKPLGTRPAYPGKRPPYKPDVPCYTNALPDLNGPAAAAGAPDRVVARSENRLRDPGAPQSAASARDAQSLSDRLLGLLNPFRKGEKR